MSLKNAAQYLAAHGRGADTTLMHVAPDEVARLQRAAQERGGSLSINPHTGLPEANFFSDLNPVHILKGEGAIGESGLGPALLALGLNYFAPGAGEALGLSGAGGLGLSNAAATGVMVGGASAALNGSLQKGLMAGLGAYGASGLGEAAMGNIGAEAATRDIAQNELVNNLPAGLTGTTSSAPMSMADTLKAGAKGISSLGTKDLLKYGLATAAPIAAAQANKKMGVPASSGEGYIRQYYFDPKTQTVKPLPVMSTKDFGNTTFESRVPYLPEDRAASGGLQAAYANGGMTHFDEGGDTKAPPTPKSIDELYQQNLGRAPDEGGAAYWAQRFGDTIDADEVNTFKGAVQAELASRPLEDQARLAPNLYFQARPDVAEAYKQNSYGMTPAEFTTAHYKNYGQYEQPNAPATSTATGNTDNTVNPNQSEAFKLAASYGPPAPKGPSAPVSKLADMPGAQEISPEMLAQYMDPSGGGYFERMRNKPFVPTPPGYFGTPTGGGGNQDLNNLVKMGVGAAASHFIPGYDYVSGARNLISGNLPGAAKDLISGLTGGISGLLSFAEGGSTDEPNTVEQLYQTVLGRKGETKGVDYWKSVFGDEVDPNELATFKNAAQAELANRTPAEQQTLAPKIVEQNQNEVSNLYRTVLGRDPDPAGLQYWSDRLTKGDSKASVFNDLKAAAKENTELGNYGLSLEDANKTYSGYQSADQKNIADEWVRNTLGREVTDADRQQQWYKDAINAKTNSSVDAAKNIYGQFQNYATSVGAATIAERTALARKAIAAKGLTDDDVLKQTGKSLTQLIGAPKTDLDIWHASQLLKPSDSPFDFMSLKGKDITTPQTYAPTGTLNPYGNTKTPGDITINPDNTRTVTPNIPGRPYGGFTGMDQVKNAYTQGGGSLGQTLRPTQTYQNTGLSADIYKYLSGQGAYPVQATGIGNNSRYYNNVAPSTTNIGAKNWVNPKTGAYEPNPNYVDPAKAAVVNTVSNSGGSGGDDNNTNMNYGANGGLMAAMARGGSTQPFFSRSTGKFNYTGPKIYADGGISVGSRPDPNIDGQYQPPPDVSFQPTVGRFAAGGEAGYNLGGYSDGGRLLRGPGDGVSDSIPATIGHKQPARLADGEFVVPARIVSELGNGSTEAGARKLYAMMERVQQARGKTVGKGKVAKNSRADKYLPV